MNKLPKDIEDIIYNYITQLNYLKVLNEIKKNIIHKIIPVENIFTKGVIYNSHLIIKNNIIKYCKIEKNKKILRVINKKKIKSKIKNSGRFIKY